MKKSIKSLVSCTLLSSMLLTGAFFHTTNVRAESTNSSSSKITMVKYVDGDGAVNFLDLAKIQSYVLGKSTSFPSTYGLTAADVNGDGVINSADVDLVKQFLLGQISQFPIQQ
jgi:arabinogalactan endo-1,4-beta-galactosidase